MPHIVNVGPRMPGWSMDVLCGGEPTAVVEMVPEDVADDPEIQESWAQRTKPCGCLLKVKLDDLFLSNRARGGNRPRLEVCCQCPCGEETPVPVGNSFRSDRLPLKAAWIETHPPTETSATPWAIEVAPGLYDPNWTIQMTCGQGDNAKENQRVPCRRTWVMTRKALFLRYDSTQEADRAYFCCNNCRWKTLVDAPDLETSGLPTWKEWQAEHGIPTGPAGIENPAHLAGG